MDRTSLLLQRVNDEVQIVTQLLDTLDQEEQVLLSDAVDQLLELSQLKSQVVGDFALASQARYALLQNMGYAPEDRSMQLVLDNNSHPLLLKNWTHFLDLVATAKEKNRVNGILLQKLSFRNQSALDVIQGRKSGALYGPNGQKNSPSNFRTTVS